MSARITRTPKPGERFTVESTYIINPAPVGVSVEIKGIDVTEDGLMVTFRDEDQAKLKAIASQMETGITGNAAPPSALWRPVPPK